MHNTHATALGGQPLHARLKTTRLKGLKSLHQRGFTLAELAIVILLGTIITGVAYLILPGIFSSYRANKVIDEFNVAIPAIQGAYQNRTSYSGLTTAQVAQNGWISNAFIETANGAPSGNLITQWGTIAFATASNNARAQVTLNNVPTRECTKIATSFSGDQYLTATVNGTTVKSGVNDIDLSAIGSQCQSTTTNTIVFTFGRA
jgi:prepilin-type N-terminal cleavage/methylation domain-containing protein